MRFASELHFDTLVEVKLFPFNYHFKDELIAKNGLGIIARGIAKLTKDGVEEGSEVLESGEILSQFNKKVSEKHILSGLYAYKNIANDNEDLDYSANWITGRYMYNLNEDWDLGLSGGYLFDNETAKNYMLGLEAGYLLKKNMWLSLGYNFEGLSDNNYSNETFYKKGIYIRFRLKLGEEDFKWLQ